jgi:NAD(P)-dependent dehydrogenase (short-subunit alcohol dehydrogenase family)
MTSRDSAKAPTACCAGVLAGRKALVTGSSRGIGRAIALALGEAGADVIINYRRDSGAAADVTGLLTGMGRQTAALQADVAVPEQARRLVAAAAERLGGLDIMVSNAGILKRQPALDIEPEDWRQILDTNLGGVFWCAQAAGRYMAEHGGGVIINMSSTGGLGPTVNLCHYCVAKAGVSMLTKSLALELARYNVRVNELNPGLIETDLNREDIARPEFLNPRMSRIPLGIVGKPADVAGAVVFLASPQAALITGHGIVIDGGARIS